ncbi:hypothetical protein BDA99DRAFT_532993 [Phascolomyces articulosus]|uniref:DUF3835 domain-containing protein n=1 Tax=Phascolomyces articulosus TaxID=60185 RepID=A0AAD5KR50_9FUNG|nr:hypothetical protein BDA99DRAFT_532993 [Phascolomyces articulosus]
MDPTMNDIAGQISQWTQRLNERQELVEAEFNRLQTFRNDYDALEKTLKTLPDETTRAAMIPIGKLAFMPGKLIHTNEITVYLGDQYYAERSTKQALGILDRRRQVVDENLRLLEAQRNGLKAKSEAGQGTFPSADLGVNEEGLPIVEIREEEPPKEKTKTMTKSIKESTVKPETSKPKDKMTWTEKEQKDVMAMLERLEAEEEDEEEFDEQQQKLKTVGDDDDEKKNRDNEYDEEEDSDDWDERYDTEIADNLFSSYDDDEDYATQGIVDQVDASAYDEEEEEENESPIVLETVKDRKIEPEPVAASSSNDIEPSPLKENVSESVIENIPLKQATDKSSDKNTTAPLDTVTPPPKTKKTSRFKVARQKERSAEAIARNIAAANRQKESDKERVVQEEIPTVKQSSSDAQKQPVQTATKQQKAQSTIPIVQTTSPAIPPVSESKNVESVEKGKKKISKFKLAREQERNAAPITTTASSSSSSSLTTTKAPPSNTTELKPTTPSSKEKKPSKFKLTRQQGRTRAAEGSSDFGIVVPEIPSVQDTRKSSSTKTIKEKDDQKSKKVTWDTVATVQEHDRSAAPSTVSSDTSSPSYTAPVKEESINKRGVPIQQRVIKSPADIFSALNDQRQILLDDGYPSLETGEDNDIEHSGMDINMLTKNVNLTAQDIWQLRDEAANPLVTSMAGSLQHSSSEANNIPQVRKTKLDSNVMRGAVLERDSEDVDLEQVEQDMDLREVTSKYHTKRQNFVAAMGGYTFDPKDVYEVYDENIPTNEPSTSKESDEVEEKPKKLSRFKAARMAALENNVQHE